VVGRGQEEAPQDQLCAGAEVALVLDVAGQVGSLDQRLDPEPGHVIVTAAGQQ
jgi:hypothetical protein